MKKTLFWVLLLCPVCLSAQTLDSVAIRQVDSLLKVSRALCQKNDFGKAFEVNAVAEKITLETLGRESKSYGSCCNIHGLIYYSKEDYPEAEQWWLECKAIREKVLGKEHPEFASIVDNLGMLYEDMGNYEKAEQTYLEAKAIRERVLGKEHKDYAAILNNLGGVYSTMGQFEKAEQHYLECRAIRERVLGKEHQTYAWSLHNLAVLYIKMGDFEQAERFQLEAKAIRERVLGKEHKDYAASLNNLANIYMSMGNYDKAESLQLEAIALREKTLGKNHRHYASSLQNLANIYYETGRYEKAEPLHLEALAIREKVLGKEHYDYALSLYNLSNLYLALENHEKAENYLREVLVIWEKTLGKEHSLYAAGLYNLGLLYYKMGQYQKAETRFIEAMNIHEKALGKQHPNYAQSLGHLAGLYENMDKFEQAESTYLELALANQNRSMKAMHHLSEQEMDDFLNKFVADQGYMLAFAQLSSSKKMMEACYDNALFYKGFLLQFNGQIKRLALSNPVAAEKFNVLKSCESSLAAQYAVPIAERDSTKVAELETQANDLEKDLARTVVGFGEAIRRVQWQEVQHALRPNEAAIEFVNFSFSENNQPDSTLYAALVLLPGTDAPLFIPLFEEKQLIALLRTDGKPQPVFYNELYATDKKGSQLYDLVWKPIAAALPEGTTAYCSPSGLLHRLNLGAIPTPDGKTLAEKHRFIMMGSTRQLVVPTVLATNQNATAQLYGGIQYDASPAIAANADSNSDDLAARRGPDFTQNDSTLRGDNWNNLRWTEVEITAAAEVMNSKGIATTLKKGAEATEESFKAIGTESHSPRILHVATHGFFFPDPKASKPGEGQAVGEKTFKVSDNPMIRSGLVLAGGNHAWKTGKPLRPELEDGILTAYEISQMNLSNTELVVLSACETGLGDLVGNEGVYGMQRAFKIAGAKYLIMSLWQVPDFQTQVFMSAFYKHWLTDEKSVPEAFRATQSELKAKYGEAFKWAGFVLVE